MQALLNPFMTLSKKHLSGVISLNHHCSPAGEPIGISDSAGKAGIEHTKYTEEDCILLKCELTLCVFCFFLAGLFFFFFSLTNVLGAFHEKSKAA